jgi:hypothetical protein
MEIAFCCPIFAPKWDHVPIFPIAPQPTPRTPLLERVRAGTPSMPFSATVLLIAVSELPLPPDDSLLAAGGL